MAEQKDKIGTGKTENAVALNVKLASKGQGAEQPVLSNHSVVGVAQGIAYVDFGFIEPAVLGNIVGAARNGKELPKAIGGRLTTRVAMPLDALVRLQQQLQRLLVGLREQREARGNIKD
jgi:hypothetical protein